MPDKVFLNDEALLEGLKNNDRHAFETLYKDNFGPVKNFILQHGGSEDSAADIFQEGIIALWNNIRDGKFELRSGTRISSYLFQVCKFKWYERTKSAHHSKSASMSAVREEPDEEPEALEGLIKKEEIDRFTSLFSQLGEKCRQILRFFYYEQLSMAEIADKLGYAPKSAKNEKYRCIMKLKAIYAKN